MSALPTAAAGAEWLGLGRSIYAVFDRELVAHALEKLQLRLQRGARQPTSQFVTVTNSGQLLLARIAPVITDEAAAQAPGTSAAAPGIAPLEARPALSGFVLVLDNITSELERDHARAKLLQRLMQGQRVPLSRLRHALERSAIPGATPEERDRHLAGALHELEVLERQIAQAAADGARELVTRWPLEEMRGADFVQAAARRIEAVTGQAVQSAEVDAALWLKLDSYALLQAVTGLAQRLKDERAVSRVALRLQPAAGDRVHLDLAWSGHTMSTETALAWELAPVAPGGQASPLTVREVVQRHGGEFWFARDPDPDHDPDLQRVCFRFLLPQAPAAAAAEAAQEQLEAAFVRNDSRPEYYDFDLFARAEAGHALDDRRLADLSYTVFDTETTGLDPAGGDEIIQIGAVRLVNGRLLRGEGFEQLVDPRRPIPAASIPIHGITPEMVAGQPTLDQVLPAFHRYAQDTVLVAHNAAFDLRFLQLKQASTGVHFEQPVLDTLLLSAVVHPNQESHRLEAIAERFGVSVIGRHTAMGDAMVTAEVFQKLVPLLAERGIHTLGQAREAAQKTWYARLEY
jgi:DNA polymerase-3 subunit epsilon